jgi:hypothetical protein
MVLDSENKNIFEKIEKIALFEAKCGINTN